MADLNPIIAYPDDPFSNTVHHPFSAFNQGWDAADSGYSPSMNPYAPDTTERRFWDHGYEEWGHANLDSEEQSDG